MIKKEEFKYELGHDQFKELLQEIEAVNSFNYKQFKAYAVMITDLLNGVNKDEIVEKVRGLQSLNYKQFRKLRRIIYNIKKTIDPQWEPDWHKPNNKERGDSDAT